MAVITSIYVISKYSCITEVIHNSDGIWEFYGDDALKEGDFKVISLEEVLQIDDSICQILFSIHSGFNIIQSTKSIQNWVDFFIFLQ